MPVPDEFQATVARVALQAASDHGFALAGGNALAVHGIISRPTHDIDLFTAEPGAVDAAAEPVASALAAAGLTVTPAAPKHDVDLGEIWDDFDQEMAEYEVSDGSRSVLLQLVRFDRSRPAVTMDIGPVLDLDDLLSTKVAALATRAEVRDLADVAAALARYDREHLIRLARQAEPGLHDEEFAEAMQRLDRLDDAVFMDQYGFSPGQVQGVRDAFADWPRSAEPERQAERREPEAEAGA